MRIAVFSDVHGNLTALDAVLADIAAQEGIDMIAFAGDLCVFGPQPDDCVERVRSHDPEISALYGNTDLWVSGPPILTEDVDAAARLRWQQIQDVVDWTRETLSPMNRAWLAELPFHRRVSPTVNPHDDLFIVHANPDNADDVIYPNPSRQREMYGEVRQTDADLETMLGDLDTGVLAFGHLHVPSIRQWKGIQLVNVASVSRPVDDDWRAKYALFEWDGSAWHAEHRHVDYDVDAQIAAYEQSRPPEWEEEVAGLRR